MKKQSKKGSGSGVLMLGALALAAVGGLVVYRQQTGGELPAWVPVGQQAPGAAPADGSGTTGPATTGPQYGSNVGQYYGGSYADRYSYLWSAGGTVVQGGGGGTLTPTRSTDASSTQGGAMTGQPVTFGVGAGRYY